MVLGIQNSDVLQPSLLYPFSAYKPKVEISAENSRYSMRTASTANDLLRLFRLRYKVFFDPHDHTFDLDFDQYDTIYDHILIEDKATGEICGTYRLGASNYVSDFYSQGEFYLDDFLKSSGVKLELGRSCIEEGHRNGRVIDLLWKGVGLYSEAVNARYLFGCSSIMSTSDLIAKSVSHYFLNHMATDNPFNVHPVGEFRLKSNLNDGLSYKKEEIEYFIPNLLKSYLKSGATVIAEPAMDREFGSIDFMTILDLNSVSSSYRKRYFNY